VSDAHGYNKMHYLGNRKRIQDTKNLAYRKIVFQ